MSGTNRRHFRTPHSIDIHQPRHIRLFGFAEDPFQRISGGAPSSCSEAHKSTPKRTGRSSAERGLHHPNGRLTSHAASHLQVERRRPHKRMRSAGCENIHLHQPRTCRKLHIILCILSRLSYMARMGDRRPPLNRKHLRKVERIVAHKHFQ